MLLLKKIERGREYTFADDGVDRSTKTAGAR